MIDIIRKNVVKYLLLLVILIVIFLAFNNNLVSNFLNNEHFSSKKLDKLCCWDSYFIDDKKLRNKHYNRCLNYNLSKKLDKSIVKDKVCFMETYNSKNKYKDLNKCISNKCNNNCLSYFITDNKKDKDYAKIWKDYIDLVLCNIDSNNLKELRECRNNIIKKCNFSNNKIANYKNCKTNCSSLNTEKDSLKNCEYNCGGSLEKQIISHCPLPSCKKNCFTIADDIDSLKNCKENCAALINMKDRRVNKIIPTDVPLPNCERNCFTINKEKKALQSCKYNCGIPKDMYPHPLPDCLSGCYSSNKDDSSLVNCSSYCGGKSLIDDKIYKVNTLLPKCKNDCFTTADDKLENCDKNCISNKVNYYHK